MAIKIDAETGKPRLINEKPTLSAEPCYTCLDKTRRYIIVSHHVDWNFVTKIIKNEKGYSSVTVFDDAAWCFSGSMRMVASRGMRSSLTPGEGFSGPHTWSRHHSITADPTGELFIVCDKDWTNSIPTI